MIIIDRFEENCAVLETDKGTAVISRSELPDTAREGDILKIRSGSYIINKAETRKRRRLISSKLGSIIKD